MLDTPTQFYVSPFGNISGIQPHLYACTYFLHHQSTKKPIYACAYIMLSTENISKYSEYFKVGTYKQK